MKRSNLTSACIKLVDRFRVIKYLTKKSKGKHNILHFLFEKMKDVKRPLLWISLFITGLFIMLSNAYIMHLEIPKIPYIECTFSGKVKDIEYKNEKVYLYLEAVEFEDDSNEAKSSQKQNSSEKHNSSEKEELDMYETDDESDDGIITPNTNLINDVISEYPILKRLGCVASFKEETIDSISQKRINIGSTVVLKGKVSFYDKADNPGEFDTRKYYISKGYLFRTSNPEILHTDGKVKRIPYWSFACKNKFSELLDSSLNEKDAGIMKALMIADKTDLDSEIKELYKDAGTSHLLAISGLHITLFASLILFILKRTPINQNVAYVLTVLILIAYGYVIGFPSSALRAIIMFGVLSLGKILMKSYDTLSALALASLITLVFKPLCLLESGFLMSYLAIVSIVLISPVFKRIGKKQIKVLSSLSMSASVTLTTLPVLVNSYYKISLYAPILNIVLVPGMTLLLNLGFLNIIFEAIFGGRFNFFAKLIHLMLFAYEFLMRLELKLPYCLVSTGARGLVRSLIYEVCLIILAVLIYRVKLRLWREKRLLINYERKHSFYNSSKEKRNIRNKYFKKLSFLFVLFGFNIAAFLYHKRDNRIEFLNVGQGLCVCVQYNGHVYFYDGGSTDRKDVYKYVLEPYMNYYAIDTVDAWFLSHEDADHINGVNDLFLADEKKVKKLIICEALEKNFEEMIELASDRDCVVITSEKGDVFKEKAKSISDSLKAFDSRYPEIEFIVLSPEKKEKFSDSNSLSQVILLKCNEADILLMGDAGEDAEKRVMEYLSKTGDTIEILQSAHHGSAIDTNSEKFLMYVKPKITVISCGFQNSYGHPHRETIENLEGTGTLIMRTDEDGAVRIKLK